MADITYFAKTVCGFVRGQVFSLPGSTTSPVIE